MGSGPEIRPERHRAVFKVAEQAGHHPLLEVKSDRHAACGRQEAVLLTDQRAPQLAQIQWQDRAGSGRGERHAGLAGPMMREDRREEALARDQTLSGPKQLAHEAAALVGRAVAEHSGHLDAGVFPDEGAGLGHRAFARIKLDLDELQVLRVDDPVLVRVGGDEADLLVRGVVQTLEAGLADVLASLDDLTLADTTKLRKGKSQYSS